MIRCTAAELERHGLFLLPVSERVLIRILVGSLSEARRKLVGSWSVGIEREPKFRVLALALRLKVQYSCTGGSCRRLVGRLSEGFTFVLRSLLRVFEIHQVPLAVLRLHDAESLFIDSSCQHSPMFARVH